MRIELKLPSSINQMEEYKNAHSPMISKAVSESKLREMLWKEIEENKRAIEIFKLNSHKQSSILRSHASKSQLSNYSYLNVKYYKLDMLEILSKW